MAGGRCTTGTSGIPRILLISSADTLILTYFKSLEEVGLYSAVIPIINLMLYFPIAISTVIMPLSAELWAKRKNTSR
jgi:O-antigen/teichoic acid export membrane protein